MVLAPVLLLFPVAEVEDRALAGEAVGDQATPETRASSSTSSIPLRVEPVESSAPP